MPDGSVDPGSLEGEALTRWYLRSPAEIEQARQAEAAARYREFFGQPRGADADDRLDSAAGSDESPNADVAASTAGATVQAYDSNPSWVQVAPNRWRAVGAAGNNDPRSIDAADPTGDPGDSVALEAPSLGAIEALQPIAGPSGDLIRPREVTFAPAQPGRDHALPPNLGSYHLNPASAVPAAARSHQPAAPPPSPQVPSITYGALTAPAPTDRELADLRRQQAAFGNEARKIDVRNSLFAVPPLAAPLVVTGLEGAAAWAARNALPALERAPLQFMEREPYLRVGDNWATRAGRRAHAALKERLAQKPGWEYEPKLPRKGQAPYRPDVGAPQRNPLDPSVRRLLELKPDTPTGRAAGARTIERYREITKNPIRLIFYNPEDFI